MRLEIDRPVTEARLQLVELGGRTAHDLGFGRISGQMLVYLYLHDGECSLDQIGEELGLSKAAVSTTARQLEALGMIRQVWRRGDRRNYYRTADNLGAALQQGLLGFMRRRLEAAGAEMDQVQKLLDESRRAGGADQDLEFVAGRVGRARVLRERVARILGSRIIRLLAR
jgi:DNA-binding transcriptional regulator GbsR (MarR family)